jgi:type I restriction enzyme M protein
VGCSLYGDADPSVFPEIHRFVVPEGCHWDDVREVSSNVGAALLHAMQEIERANRETLFRVFGTADWGNKDNFTDELLKDLVEGFSEIELGNRSVTTDALGDAYEYLIGKFADITRRNKAGEFYTPRSVVRMMVEMLDPQEGESICDPACATGGMLLGAIEHVTRKGGDARTFYGKIYGQEKNLTTSAIARMNLVLHGIEDFQIAREDTLRGSQSHRIMKVLLRLRTVCQRTILGMRLHQILAFLVVSGMLYHRTRRSHLSRGTIDG